MTDTPHAAHLVDVHIVFSGEGPNLTFVEVETPDSVSLAVGNWLERDGYKVLALTVVRPATDASDRAEVPRR